MDWSTWYFNLIDKVNSYNNNNNLLWAKLWCPEALEISEAQPCLQQTGQNTIWFLRPEKLLKIVVISDMTCRHSYRKETNLSDIHDFDSSQLSCPLVTALCSTQINKSYFVATMVLIYFLTQLKRAGVPKQDLASVLRIVCEICYWLCSTSLFQWSPPVHKERAGTAREKSNINNNPRIVQLSNRGGVITHFGALLHSM